MSFAFYVTAILMHGHRLTEAWRHYAGSDLPFSISHATFIRCTKTFLRQSLAG